MARPNSIGITYYPRDVHMSSDLAIKLLVAKYKAEGYALYNEIISQGYASKGYYYETDEDNILLLSSYFGIESERVNEIIDFCKRKELFSADKHDKYKILTSPRMQRTYIRVSEQRTLLTLELAYLLIYPIHEITKKSKFEIIYTDMYNVSTVVNLLKSDFYTLNKREREKEKEREREKEKEPALENVRAFFEKNYQGKEKGSILEYEKFYRYYSARNWKGIENWTDAAKLWILRAYGYSGNAATETETNPIIKNIIAEIVELKNTNEWKIFAGQLKTRSDFNGLPPKEQKRIKERLDDKYAYDLYYKSSEYLSNDGTQDKERKIA